ncbi:MAG: hypothetical protein BWY02_02699 [bacterium ADurb.Bin157]|nr:MAG: hypothetical protein BWY02_02699 [bacterium ADurb.Bin157]
MIGSTNAMTSITGAAYNVYFDAETPPADTSKLWIKSAKVSFTVGLAVPEELEEGTGFLLIKRNDAVVNIELIDNLFCRPYTFYVGDSDNLPVEDENGIYYYYDSEWVSATVEKTMELYSAGDLICRLDGPETRDYRKVNSGWSVGGYYYNGGYTESILVSDTFDAAKCKGDFYEYPNPVLFTYNGIALYYGISGVAMAGNLTSTATDMEYLYKCSATTPETAAIELLDKYYGVI